jgi:hypothetical protein
MTTPGSSDAVLNDSDLAGLCDLSTWEQVSYCLKLFPEIFKIPKKADTNLLCELQSLVKSS